MSNNVADTLNQLFAAEVQEPADERFGWFAGLTRVGTPWHPKPKADAVTVEIVIIPIPMHRLQKATLTILAATLLGSVPAQAQTPRLSPPEITSTHLAAGSVTLVYSRPFSKNPKGDDIRKIWGGVVPFGEVWRTGANEATMFVTEVPLDFSGTTVPAGAYTLYTLPMADGTAKLIFSKHLGQWGSDYPKGEDLARIDLQKSATDKQVDQFTMGFDRDGDGKTATGGTLKMMWENTKYSAPFTVKK